MSSVEKAFDALDGLVLLGTKRKDKENLLNFYANLPELKQLFVLTYDWMKTYGIKVSSQPKSDDGSVSAINWTKFKTIADALSKREITGNAARELWNNFLDGCSPKEKYWYSNVLNRDLRIGVAEKTISKVWPDALSPFGCQLADVYESARTTEKDFPLWSEPKFDGMRVLIVVNNKSASVHSRNGKELPSLQFFADAFVKTLPGQYVVDGEVFHKDWNTTISLSKTDSENLTEDQKAVLKELTYFVFDAVPLEDFNKGFCETPLSERSEHFTKLIQDVNETVPEVNIALTLTTFVFNDEDINKQYEKALSEGFEGIMLKNPKAPYKFGRNRAWCKVKPEETLDAKIIDVLPGTGRNKDRLGAFVVQLEDGQQANVGSGFSDEDREKFWAERGSLIGRMVEFKAQKDLQSVAVVRFPVFVRFRDDK